MSKVVVRVGPCQVVLLIQTIFFISRHFYDKKDAENVA